MRWDDTSFVEAKVATGSPPNEMEGKKEELRQRLREALSNAGAGRRRKVGIVVVREHDVLYFLQIVLCCFTFYLIELKYICIYYIYLFQMYIYIYKYIYLYLHSHLVQSLI